LSHVNVTAKLTNIRQVGRDAITNALKTVPPKKIPNSRIYAEYEKQKSTCGFIIFRV
jgi:hypothetical protein